MIYQYVKMFTVRPPLQGCYFYRLFTRSKKGCKLTVADFWERFVKLPDWHEHTVQFEPLLRVLESIRSAIHCFSCVRVFKGTVSPDILDYILGSGKLKNTFCRTAYSFNIFLLFNSLDIQKLLFKLLL
jgi:hypothetical protein